MNRLGFWTLTFLVLSLVATPAKDFLGLAWPIRIRRLVGLLAFGYGALHLAWYAVLDKFFDVDDIAADVTKRPFITVGLAAVLLLLPLAVTSTDRWVRRLGYRRWKRLHRLTYLAAGLGLLHLAWRVKADRLKPELFGAALGLLLALRLVAYFVRSSRRHSEVEPTLGSPRGSSVPTTSPFRSIQ
jgi:sulfoxide reductase heme-binding subunit YedZ